MVWRKLVGAAVLWLAGAGLLSAAPAERIDVPVMVRTYGPLARYFVPIVVGDTKTEALLDTGAAGLFVVGNKMPSGARYATPRTNFRATFLSGQTLLSTLAEGNVDIGETGRSARMAFQLIRKVGCPKKNGGMCGLPPAVQKILAPLMIGGDAGYQAVLGINLVSTRQGYAFESPLAALGDSWLLLVPPPGSPGNLGHLIINPSPDEVAGFSRFAAATGKKPGSYLNNPMPGCIEDLGSQHRFCGSVYFDSGSPFNLISVIEASKAEWSSDGLAELSLDVPGGAPLSTRFVVSGKPFGTVQIVSATETTMPTQSILVGVQGYLLFAVLYDRKRSEIGLKLRWPATTPPSAPNQAGVASPSVQ